MTLEGHHLIGFASQAGATGAQSIEAINPASGEALAPGTRWPARPKSSTPAGWPRTPSWPTAACRLKRVPPFSKPRPTISMPSVTP